MVSMKLSAALLCAAVLAAGCDQVKQSPAARPVMISNGFIDDESYGIVCHGYPEPGLDGAARNKSSVRAARLFAYLIIDNIFIEKVDPAKGLVEKAEVFGDYAVLHYVLRKKGLRKLLRKEPKIDPDILNNATPEFIREMLAPKETEMEGDYGSEAAPVGEKGSAPGDGSGTVPSR